MTHIYGGGNSPRESIDGFLAAGDVWRGRFELGQRKYKEEVLSPKLVASERSILVPMISVAMQVFSLKQWQY